MVIVGRDVINESNFVKKLVTHSETFNNISWDASCAKFNAVFDILILVILIFPIVSWICVYALSIYIFKVCKRFVDSEINEIIPHATLPIIMVNTIIKIIIELIFLESLVFFIKYFIAGSTIKEIINATRNGM